MNEKKVLIGCPTHERYRYCIDPYLNSVRNIDYKNFELYLVDNSPDENFYKLLQEKKVNCERIKHISNVMERIVRSRNILLYKAVKENFDYFLSLEQDVIIERDTLKKLISDDKPIISAYYANRILAMLKDNKTGELRRQQLEIPIIYLKEDGKIRRASPMEILGKGIIKVGGCGLGCMLIKREVFTKIMFRHEENKQAFDDMFFCKDAEKLGYEIFVDTKVKVKHLHRDWERNI